jgi:threonine/homoserine/homoserine lactone efflux protein
VRCQRGHERDTSGVLDNLLAFVLVSVIVICVPGPDTAMVVRNTLSAGRSSGIATALGVTLGIIFWVFAASVDLAALLRASEPVFQA